MGLLLLALALLGLASAPATGTALTFVQNPVFLPFIAAAPPSTLTPTPTETHTPTATWTPTQTLTPSVTPTTTATRQPGELEWDERLDQRGAKILYATPTPGQGYWRLIKGIWYGPEEPPFAGQHHIFVDALRPDGSRQPGVAFNVTNLDATMVLATIVTELKPGDPYAANFPMYQLAPAYRTMPSDGSPADAVTNLGLGSIEYPYLAYHTSYGFVWQWTVAPAATETPTSTPTSTKTLVLEGVRQ
jgi:hypothetical protein